MGRKRITVAMACAFMLSACATPSSPPTDDATLAPGPVGPFGETKQSAIEVCMPLGEREYLSRLTCGDGSAAVFQRHGNVGNRFDLPKIMSDRQQAAILHQSLDPAPLKKGQVDYHVVDAYEVKCGAESRQIYLDMYHCGQSAPTSAPNGLTIRPAASVTPVTPVRPGEPK